MTVFPQGFLERISSALQRVRPSRAVLFGSATRLGLTARDIDVLVVAEAFEHVLWQNRPSLVDLPGGPVYDLRLFTPLEFETILPRGHPLRERIETDKIDLVPPHA